MDPRSGSNRERTLVSSGAAPGLLSFGSSSFMMYIAACPGPTRILTAPTRSAAASMSPSGTLTMYLTEVTGTGPNALMACSTMRSSGLSAGISGE